MKKQKKDPLFYRGHQFVLRQGDRENGTHYLDIAVYTAGCALEGNPLTTATTEFKERDRAEFARKWTIREGRKFVDNLFRGVGVPPTAVHKQAFHFAKDVEGIRGRSRNKKSYFCDEHWSDVRRFILAGNVDGIVLGMLLVASTIRKAKDTGLLANTYNQDTFEMLTDSYVPLCCFVGGEQVGKIIWHSRPEIILAGHAKEEADIG